MRRWLVLFALTFVTVAPAFAQRAAAPAPPPAAPAPPGRAPAPPREAPPRVSIVAPESAPPVPFSHSEPLPKSWKNVRLEITITDTAQGTGQKTVVLQVVDGRRGSIRVARGSEIINADAVVTLPDARMIAEIARAQLSNPRLNADPRYGEEGKLLVDLTIQYRPAAAQPGGFISTVDESISVVLTEGAKTMISQAADPSSDRKVTVELTATTVK